MINWYGMGGSTVLGQDVVGDGALVAGVYQLSCSAGTGGTGVPGSLGACAAS